MYLETFKISKTIQTIGIQSIGSIATIITVFAVTSRYGLEGQGYWATYRSVLELICALVIFGFPQLFTYTINKNNTLLSDILRFCLRYLALVWPVISILIFFSLSAGVINAGGEAINDSITLILSGLLYVIYAFIRGISIAITPIHIYNLITILPSIAQLLLIYLWPSKSIINLSWIIMASLLASVFICIKLTLKFSNLNERNNNNFIKIWRPDLILYGFWWFLTGFLQMLIPFVFYQLIQCNENKLMEVGNLSIAFLVVGAMLLPINILGPLIFNDLTKITKENQRQILFTKIGRLLMVSTIIATGLFNIYQKQISITLLHGRYVEAVSIAAVMILSIPFAYYTRLVNSMAASDGDSNRNAILMGLRVACTIIPPFIFPINLELVAWSYAFGEIMSAIFSVIYLKNIRNWSWRYIFMIS